MTAFTHIQSVAKDDNGNTSTTHTISLSSTSAGSVIKVGLRIPSAADITVSVADDKSQSYTEQNHNFISGFGLFTEFFFLNSVSGAAVITITLSVANGARIIAEELGVSGGPTLAFDGTPVNGAVTAGTAVSSGNEVAGGSDVLLMSTNGWNAAGFSPVLPSLPAAWTKGTDIPTGGGKLVTAYLLGQGAGTYAASWGAGATDDGYASIAIVKASSAVAAPFTPFSQRQIFANDLTVQF